MRGFCNRAKERMLQSPRIHAEITTCVASHRGPRILCIGFPVFFREYRAEFARAAERKKVIHRPPQYACRSVLACWEQGCGLIGTQVPSSTGGARCVSTAVPMSSKPA